MPFFILIFIIIIFLLIYNLGYDLNTIFLLYLFFLLNMQIYFYRFKIFITQDDNYPTKNFFDFIDYFNIVKLPYNLFLNVNYDNFFYFLFSIKETIVNILNDILPSNKIEVDFLKDESDLVEQLIELLAIYKWFLLPICLYFFIIYILHGLLGIYSAYVDYFQKNPEHFQSFRAILPAIFIFYFLIFIFFVLIFYFIILLFHYILWFLFI